MSDISHVNYIGGFMTWDVIYWLSRKPFFFLLILGVDRRLRKSRPISKYHKNLAGFNSCGLFSLRKKKGKNSAAHLSYPTLVHSYSVCTGLKLSGSKPLIDLECLHFCVCVACSPCVLFSCFWAAKYPLILGDCTLGIKARRITSTTSNTHPP